MACPVAVRNGRAKIAMGMACEFRVCNGGRARAGRPGGRPSRRPGNARTHHACEFFGCNGGAIRTSRRVRGPAAHRAADRAAACKTLSVCYLPSRAPRWRATTGSGEPPRALACGYAARNGMRAHAESFAGGVSVRPLPSAGAPGPRRARRPVTPAPHGAHDAKPPDALPRTAVASRHGRWRGGAMGTSRPERCAHHGARTVRTQRDRTTGRDVWPPGLLAHPPPAGRAVVLSGSFLYDRASRFRRVAHKTYTHTNTHPYPFS